jgi:splicing factor 3A subunit 3
MLVELESKFTGEESLGKYFDLHELYSMYLNLKGVEKWSYLNFLDRFDRFKVFTPQTKSSNEYYNYLSKLEEYLIGWLRRAQPLFSWENFQNEAKLEFDNLWNQGIL